MNDIGVIGDYDSICGFSAVGFDIFPVESTEQAGKELRALIRSEYKIIYMTEPLMQQLQPACDRYHNQTVPCIVPLPACSGVTGFGTQRLRHCVEQAVGSDIIFNDDK